MSEIVIQEYERAGKIEGWSYLILDEKGIGRAYGYYRLKKYAEYMGNLALSIFQEQESES